MSSRQIIRFLTAVAALAVLNRSASSAEEAPGEIVRGADHFEFTYRVTLPTLDTPARLWLPVAKSDEFQMVKVLELSTSLPSREIHDQDYHNTILTFSPAPADSGKVIEIRYDVRRREKSAYPPHVGEDPTRYLAPEHLVPTSDTFRKIASEVLREVPANDDSRRARALYDHTLRHMRYDKTGTGWGRGDALRACDSTDGNCTDFHSYFIALARAAGIPARFAIGVTIPAGQDEGTIAGYHCWAEFFADGLWIPVDISEAWNHPELAKYYFGHHPANRFELSVGRDLVVDPSPASGPINFLVYPTLEVGGHEVKAPLELRFRRIHGEASAVAAIDLP